MNAQTQIIGSGNSAPGQDIFYSYNPATGANNEQSFYRTTAADVDLAVEKAAGAFKEFRKKTGSEKAIFLEAIGEAIMLAGDELITTCMAETALPQGRIEGERARTVNQLKMFAALLREGSWVDARIDTAIPDRVPLPKPDLRFMQIPLGPVVVFGASNFPLAFSVAGGDTASALAAGCTVVVKSHPAHPATSAIVGKAIQSAALKTNMPDGVFSLLFDNGIESGLQLVKHKLVKAVGFTGSYKAGKALYDAAVSRPEPIPVYAEMGSSNPVFVLPMALKERGHEIAAAYAASVTLGVGQFCTNPGLLIHQGKDDPFKHALITAFQNTTGGVMLTTAIANAYQAGLEKHLAVPGVEQLATSNTPPAAHNAASPILLQGDSQAFNDNPRLSEEVFGPTGMLVSVDTKQAMLDTAEGLSGHLTATVHGTADELPDYQELLDILEQKVGRVVFNGFPTGVEVCSSMVHGGPFPATTDSKTTSVGTAAIDRFTRPVCYQNLPQLLLPAALQDNNLLGIYRLVNGERTKMDIVK